MYARLQITDRMPTGPDAPAGLARLLDTIAGHPGFRGVYALPALGSVTGHLLSFWDSHADAAEAGERTRAVLGQPTQVVLTYDRILHVEDAWAGHDFEATPQAAAVMFIDGPLSDAQTAAGRRAHHDRILPAVLAVPGIVGGWVLLDTEQRAVRIVALATSVEALTAGDEAIMATELLPGEDPALLRGPDRTVPCRVDDYRGLLPAAMSLGAQAV